MEIELSQIIFQLINFSVVVGAVTYLLYKPVLKILEERTNRVEEAQKAATQTLAEKDRIAEAEKKTIKSTEKKAAQILDEARESAKETQKELLAAAKEQSQKVIEKAKQEWEEEKQQHLKTIRAEFAKAVVAASQKVLQAEIDTKKQESIIDQQLKELVARL